MFQFTVKLFGMRHPAELRGLLDHIEAIERAKAGAEDGAIDPEEATSNEQKFAALEARYAARAPTLRAPAPVPAQLPVLPAPSNAPFIPS